MTLKEEKKIIANYLRWETGEKDEISDDEIIGQYGGDTHNRIIVDFRNGLLLYKSVDSGITVYNMIDIHDLSDSFAAEPINYDLEKEVVGR